MNSQNKMMGDESYAFGCLWARRGIFTVNDLWDSQRHTWRRTVDLAHQLGQKLSPERYEEMLLSIPSTWCIRGNPAFQQFEWVASLHEGKVDQIFQLTSPWHGTAFKEIQPTLFIPGDLEEVDISGMDLKRIRMVSTTGDLKSSKLNPKEETLSPVWLIGITQKLQFDPGEWSWVSNESELPFFNYMAKVGYHAGLDGKCQESRLQIKLRELKYTDNEIQAAIALIWDSNKPAKLQHFAWQVASGGLFTGSRARHLGFPGDCIQCNSGLLETTKHCLNFCSFARKAWKWASTFREAFGLHKEAPWKEKMTGIQPGTIMGMVTPCTTIRLWWFGMFSELLCLGEFGVPAAELFLNMSLSPSNKPASWLGWTLFMLAWLELDTSNALMLYTTIKIKRVSIRSL
jgi:hypothetical protein